MASEKRIAIYARVSTTDQNPDMQISELREYARRRGFEIFGEFVDTISGTKSSRPALDKLMRDARRRRFDGILVWRFDRFARSTSHLLAALEEFNGLKLDFISLHEQVDTSTPTGKMVFTVLASVAELERSIIVERVRAGIQRARAKGKKLGRPRGSKIDAAKVAELRKGGLSIRRIAVRMGIGVGSVQAALVAHGKTPLKIVSPAPMGKAAV